MYAFIWMCTYIRVGWVQQTQHRLTGIRPFHQKTIAIHFNKWLIASDYPSREQMSNTMINNVYNNSKMIFSYSKKKFDRLKCQQHHKKNYNIVSLQNATALYEINVNKFESDESTGTGNYIWFKIFYAKKSILQWLVAITSPLHPEAQAASDHEADPQRRVIPGHTGSCRSENQTWSS